MTHRERFRAVAEHRQADRAVFDLGGSPQTQIDYAETQDALLAHLGFGGPRQGDFPVDDRLLEAFDIDTRLVGDILTPETVHCREENGVRYNSFGIGSRWVNGHYEICHNPLRDMDIDEVLAWPVPEAADYDRKTLQKFAEKAKYLHENTDYAIVASHPVLGVFELGCWMFGFDDYLYRLAAEPETVHAFSRRYFAYQKDVIEMYYGALGRYIDCTTSGDDFGTQKAPFMSNAMFDEYIKPYYRDRIALTKTYTDAFYQHHTCGSVHPFIPALIECGVDILNPIQPGVYQMEPERLKADYGDKIAFWGGVDTQHLLPGGSVAEVKAEVGRLLSILDRNGGYVLSPAHCLQNDIPPENIAALYFGAREYYGA